MKILMIVVSLFASVALAQPSENLLDAIEQVESSGMGANTPDGDGGKAIGPFQIHRAYWKDAVEFDRTIGGKYEDCRKPEYARKIVRAYLSRYGKGKSAKELARIHNGGPKGHRKASTLPYWEKVDEILR